MLDIASFNPVAVLSVLSLMGSIVGAWTWVAIQLARQAPILPPITPRVVPWGWKSVLGVVVVYFVVQIAVTVAIIVVFQVVAPAPKGELSPTAVMIGSGASNALILVAVPLMLFLTSRATLKDFGVQLAGFGKQILRGVITYPLIAPVVFGVMILALQVWKEPDVHPLQKAIQADKSPGMAILLIVAGAVLAPAAEELVFRGILLGYLIRRINGVMPGSTSLALEADPSMIPIDRSNEMTFVEAEPDAELFTSHGEGGEADLYAPPMAPIGRDAIVTPLENNARRKPYSLIVANAGVSLLFAAMHLAVWPSPIPLFFLSMGLGLLYIRTGSILAPIALHMTFNGVSTVAMFLAIGKPDDPPKTPEPIPAPAKAEPDGKVVPMLVLPPIRTFPDRAGFPD